MKNNDIQKNTFMKKSTLNDVIENTQISKAGNLKYDSQDSNVEISDVETQKSFDSSDNSNEYKAPFRMVFYSNLPLGRYKRGALVHFKNILKDKGYTFKVNETKREIFAPEVVEILKEKLVPASAIASQKNIKEISDVFNYLNLSNSNAETEKILDLLIHQKYKLIGYFKSTDNKTPINIIFERSGSNYKVLDYGKVSTKILSHYLS
jgi:hypothetical protein